MLLQQPVSKLLIFILLICMWGCGGGDNSSSSNGSATATAKCNDGTFSYSQNCSGTCSSHGGVQIWYVSNCGNSKVVANEIEPKAEELNLSSDEGRGIRYENVSAASK